MSLGRPARPRLDHGARKGKGDDYQEVDVNGKRLSHKNTKKGLTGTIFYCKTSDRLVSLLTIWNENIEKHLSH